MKSELRLFIPIGKVDEVARTVYGVLTAETPDKSGEIFDYESGKPAVQAWSDEIKLASKGKSLGNVRAMHDTVAAGKFTDIVYDDANKRIEGAAKIIDSDEWEKVVSGVYTGFSIGGSYTKRWKDAETGLWRFTPKLSEISLVDNPCVGEATFEYIKSDGSREMRKFHTPTNEESMTTAEEGGAAAGAEPKVAEAAVTKAAGGEPAGTGEPKPAADGEKPVLVKDGKAVKPQIEPEQRWLSKRALEVLEAAGALDEAPVKKEDARVRNLILEKQVELAPAMAKMNALLKGEAATEEKPAAEDGKPVEKTEEPAKPAEEPAPVEKADKPKLLAKGLHQIGWMAELLSSLQSLQGSVEFEQMWEQNKSSELPAKFKGLVSEMCQVLVALVDEETKELIAGDDTDVEVLAMAAKMDSAHAAALAKHVSVESLKTVLEKAGARHSKSDMDKFADMHKMVKDHADAMTKMADDHCDTMGKCMKDAGMIANDASKSTEPKELQKLNKALDMLADARADNAATTEVLTKMNTTLEKAMETITTLSSEKTDLASRIEHLEKQPAAAKGSVKAISKTQDNGGSGDADAAAEYKARLAKMTPEESSRELMKLALTKPVEHLA